MADPNPHALLDPHRLLGRWDLDRQVTDRLAGLSGRMVGTLRVSDDAGRLRWEEEGTLQWRSQRLLAHRNLALGLVDDEWWMLFEDGGLFHRWQPDERLEHPCGEDHYVGRLHLDPDGREMQIEWDVTGPSKQQRILTRYRRHVVISPVV